MEGMKTTIINVSKDLIINLLKSYIKITNTLIIK